MQQQLEQATANFHEELEGHSRWSQETLAEDRPLAKELEARIRQWIQEIGADTPRLMRGHMERHRRKGQEPYPQCGTKVYWKEYIPGQYISTLGELAIERAYYHHGACHQGWVPLDAQLGLGASELSPLVQEMVSYRGAYMPFGRTQKYLARYHHLQLSHDTVNAATVMTGQAWQQQQSAAIEQACTVRTPPRKAPVRRAGPPGQGWAGMGRVRSCTASTRWRPRR